MSTKHTPGPWKLLYTPEGSFEVVEPHDLCRIVARGHGADAEGKANARLIASAPELLAELRELVFQYEALQELDGHKKAAIKVSTEKARAAIAKAVKP